MIDSAILDIDIIYVTHQLLLDLKIILWYSDLEWCSPREAMYKACSQMVC